MTLPIPEIVQEAKRKNLQIRWVDHDDCSYDQSRAIANARFSYKPSAIAYCETAESVASLFQIFANEAPKLRVRSGGHQHEGMCSADGVLLVDLSELDRIGWDPKTKQHQKLYPDLCELWIQPGAYLGDVYRKLEGCWKTLPAGGCFHVNVGGLVQGGGWGLLLRKFGLTCDNLLEAEVVLASGEKVFASKDEKPELFWAIRGGGGGNFGVVTNFKLQIYPLAETMTNFTLQWTKTHRLKLVRKWMEIQNDLPEELTTFGRIAVTSKADDPAFILGGQFYGSQKDLEDHLEPFCKIAKPISSSFRPRTGPKPEPCASRHADREMMGAASSEQPMDPAAVEASFTSLMAELIADLQPGVPRPGAEGATEPKAPTSTCSRSDGWAFQPHPHKVSSAFPKSPDDYDQLAEDLIKVVEGTQYDQAVNRYVSLHGFGGKVADMAKDETAFPYRDKDFMLQFQAWWSAPKSNEPESYVQWIENFRKSLQGVEGAFINFPDISLVADQDKDRVELLRRYYADNLPRLRRIKAKVDPHSVFSFGMSIPPS